MLFNSLRRTLGRPLKASFSTAAETLQKESLESYNSFRTAYLAQLKKVDAKIQSPQSTGAAITGQKRTTKAYRHPFHDPEVTPIVITDLDYRRSFFEQVGPQTVSPHYENFAMSRKWALTFWGGMGALTAFANLKDFHHLAATAIMPFFLYIWLFYWFLEGRKSIIKPLLFRFHNLINEHEFKLTMAYWNDSMREFLLARMDAAKEQIDYYSVHQDYHSIKAESINRFLAIEQVNLKNHINVRAQRLLQSAEQLEASNQRYLINSIVSEALAEVNKIWLSTHEVMGVGMVYFNKTLDSSIDLIQDAMFESALIGIRKQQMTYENDPLLPLIKERIEAKIKKLTTLTEEQKIQLIQLTNDQLESLRTLDRQIRDEFLKKQPKLDNSIKAYPTVKKALDGWGKGGAEAGAK